jgi:hypothetical protein
MPRKTRWHRLTFWIIMLPLFSDKNASLDYTYIISQMVVNCKVCIAN